MCPESGTRSVLFGRVATRKACTSFSGATREAVLGLPSPNCTPPRGVEDAFRAISSVRHPGRRVEIWRGSAGPVSRSRSSNRTCSLPASGFRTRYLAYAHDRPRTRRCLRCGIQRSLHRLNRSGVVRLIPTSISLALAASALTLN